MANIPDIVNNPNTIITLASTGQQTSVPNPLYLYRFHPLNSNDFPPSEAPIATDPTTVRSPNANAALNNMGAKQGVVSLPDGLLRKIF